jgi:cysteine desulfurase/selenocysteine lyase
MGIISSGFTNRVIYFDNAATSFPKPETVVEASMNYLKNSGGNPGRSGHRLSIEAGNVLFSARQSIAKLFSVSNPMRIIFTSNATEGLNLAILGTARAGFHVITSSMEHNSTIRPLKELESRGIISLTIVKCSSNGFLDPDDFIKSIKPETKMAVINHASNSFGTLQPVREIGKICREKGIIFIVDAAQSAGIINIDINKDNIDMLAFSGHKSLYGPTGTGGLVISDSFDYKLVKPLKFGGTGSFSDKIIQPDFLPDVFESGTPNSAGIYGLSAGLEFIDETGLDNIRLHKKNLVEYFVKKASEKVDGYINYIPADFIETGVVSFNIEGIQCSDVSEILSDEYEIMSRAGLQCTPLSHQTIGTFPDGTVRFSFGIYNTKEEIDNSISALKNISNNRR